MELKAGGGVAAQQGYLPAACRRAGEAMLQALAVLGRMVLTATHIAAAARRRRLDQGELWRALHTFGNASLPLTLTTAVFMGLMLVLQSAAYVRQYGAHELIGYFTAFSVLRELGPVVLGLMLSGRVGANNAAELATLGATERLDALQTLQVDVAGWLLLPRTLAMVVSQVALLMFFILISLVAAGGAARLVLGVPWSTFWRSAIDGLSAVDLLVGVGKAAVFGFVVAVISSTYGCAYRGAVTGVGQAVRQQVVASAVCLFAIDYGLTVALAGR